MSVSVGISTTTCVQSAKSAGAVQDGVEALKAQSAATIRAESGLALKPESE